MKMCEKSCEELLKEECLKRLPGIKKEILSVFPKAKLKSEINFRNQEFSFGFETGIDKTEDSLSILEGIYYFVSNSWQLYTSYRDTWRKGSLLKLSREFLRSQIDRFDCERFEIEAKYELAKKALVEFEKELVIKEENENV